MSSPRGTKTDKLTSLLKTNSADHAATWQLFQGCLVQHASKTSKFWQGLKQDAGSSDKGLELLWSSEIRLQIPQVQSVKS